LEDSQDTLEKMLLATPMSVLKGLVDSVDLESDKVEMCANALSNDFKSFVFTIDSGSDAHVLTLEAAIKLFTVKQASNLRVTGVSGSSTRADVMGRLLISVEDPSTLKKYVIDMGRAHGMKNCPVNILSVSLLIKVGAIVHFEKDNSYFQPRAGAEKIPFIANRGLFQLQGEKADDAHGEVDSNSKQGCSYVINGRSFAITGDLKLWHRRLCHVSKERLLRIFKHNLVDGFKMAGRMHTTCDCDTCKQARIRRSASPHETMFESKASFIGHTVSTDVKSLPYASFMGYRYVLVFVDHYSRLSFCYFLRSKNEVTSKLRTYVNEMKRLGVTIHTIQSDRGSEYFEQEGESFLNRGRRLHEFGKFCEDHEPKIIHVVQPVEMKEKLAEGWFKDHFTAVDAMLWDARLSPAFWADACEYSNYCHNRTPNEHLGGQLAPWQVLTGERPSWHKLKVFGCDVFEHIPNNMYAKVPGVPKGRKLIFMGFQDNRAGFKCFDPETRRYLNVGNCYFYEDFSSRIDSLRHHDRRREMLKRGIEQPIVIDDFADTNPQAVRNLFLDPDPPVREPPLADRLDAGRRGALEKATDEPHPSAKGPLSDQGINAEKARQRVQHEVMLRPLRLLAVGKAQPISQEDRAFLEFARIENVPIIYQKPCPKSPGGESYRRYMKYMHAKTYREAFELGATMKDFAWDYERGWICFPKHEPVLSAHVFNANELATQHGFVHVLQEIGLAIKDSHEIEEVLAQTYTARLVTGDSPSGRSFQQVLKTVYEPEAIVKIFEDVAASRRFAEEQAAKVLNAIYEKIDFSASPEPVRFEDTQAEVCAEHEQWKRAMDEEIESMARFGVFKRVPKSAAKGRQILGCRWVYKRKANNKEGVVTRYRARLVAQGYAQKAFDSYQPDETFSPVVHKDSLRMFLAMCAALDLRIYQADVKAAFLQVPLSEKIYLKAPPGYSSSTENGEEEILELSSAIYGLKQSSACFWTALNKHLVSQGFKSVTGDPCVFKKVLPDGKIIFACTFVDDITYGVSDQDTADAFLAGLRERFVIDDGEGKPIDFLLGMAISQDVDAGTVKMSMELMITKLATSILTAEELAKSRGVLYPMLVTPLLKATERLVEKKSFDYLSVIGSLLHIANCVRCDISYAVGALARHANAPGPQHVNAAKEFCFICITHEQLELLTRKVLQVKNRSFLKERNTRWIMVRICCKLLLILIMRWIFREGQLWDMF
jgi:hypothetical protein